MTLETSFETTDDAFLGGRLKVLQPATGFRSGIDAVLLAASVAARPGQAVLDVGTGAGVVALCIACRIDGVSATGIDIQPELCALARANAGRNGFAEVVAIAEADIRMPAEALAEAGLARHSFDCVVANPPYYEEGRARASSDPGRARSNMLGPEELERWIRFMVSMARGGASIGLVHRADALPDLLRLLDRRVGAVQVRPIHPRADEPASRVLVTGRTGSRAPLALLPGFVLHEDSGGYTEAAQQVLRHGVAL